MRVYRLSNFENMCTDTNFPNNGHIIGDAAYSLSNYVIVPFKDNGHLLERQINFNQRLSSARMIVERSLGLLKGRFRRILDTLPMQRTDLIPKYLIACCILHNICLLKGDMIDIPIIIDESDMQNPETLQDNAVQRNAIQKRNTIMYSLPCNVFTLYT